MPKHNKPNRAERLSRRKERALLNMAKAEELSRDLGVPADEIEVVSGQIPGHRKISELLTELVHPMVRDDFDIEQFKTLLSLGCIAWNLTLFQPEQRQPQTEQLLAMVPLEDREQMREALTSLMARKDALFSSDLRMILDFEVTDRKYDWYVTAVSTLNSDIAADVQPDLMHSLVSRAGEAAKRSRL